MTIEEATEKFPREAGITRYGDPKDIAELMAFLVSPEARWMTRATVRMDEGRGQVDLRVCTKRLSHCLLLIRRQISDGLGKPLIRRALHPGKAGAPVRRKIDVRAALNERFADRELRPRVIERCSFR
jgi:hypothetical protein